MTNQLISYNGVELRNKELLVLKNASLDIRAGEFAFLIGKVGSGKSTLLRSIYADSPISEGSAYVLGYNLNSIKRKEIPFLRRQIGFVFQDFKLLTDRNVYDNLDFVLVATGWRDKAARDQRIEEVLKAVGMDKKHYKMPYELSGGEQQRIAIARSLLNKPKLILADEPTGNLDPATGDQIMERLHQISEQGTAVLIATHNMHFVKAYPAKICLCENKSLIHNPDLTLN